MVPFGRQQEFLRDLSTSNLEELSGNRLEAIDWRQRSWDF
jgi:hypothetical protein